MTEFKQKLKEVDDHVWEAFSKYNDEVLKDHDTDWCTWLIDELDTVITFWGISKYDTEKSVDIPIEYFNNYTK